MERKELWRYSVWEQQEMEAQEVYFKHEEDFSPPAVLLLYVSETAAAAAHQELLKLCVEPDETTNTGKKADNVDKSIILNIHSLLIF